MTSFIRGRLGGALVGIFLLGQVKSQAGVLLHTEIKGKAEKLLGSCFNVG